jgi:ankyrin repeat protein
LAGDTLCWHPQFPDCLTQIYTRRTPNCNARNAGGVTTLMFLAATGEADEVKEALEAGASPPAKDVQGRPALDYLRLARGGNSPVTEHPMFLTSGCDARDQDEVRPVAGNSKEGKTKAPKLTLNRFRAIKSWLN